MRLLHQAPDAAIRLWLQSQPGIVYLTGDVADLLVTLRYDLEHMPFRSASLDMVIASHVMEHVKDDRAAMRELARVLRPGGSAVLMVPIDGSRTDTYEDETVNTPELRTVAYWQSDHLRLYGRDFPKRLSESGFLVAMERPSMNLEPAAARRYGLFADPVVFENLPIAPPDEIYIATRPGSQGVHGDDIAERKELSD